MTYSINLSASTNSTGTTWNAFPSAGPVEKIHVLNTTGTTLSFRLLGETIPFELPTNFAWTFLGMTNAAHLTFKRTDESNTPVTLKSIQAEFGRNC